MNLENRRLILISNAEPYAHSLDEGEIRCEKLAGGLTSGLDPLMRDCGGLWIAWGRGEADFRVLDSDGIVKVPEGSEDYSLKRIKLSENEVEGFYLGFSNELLWPIFHSFPERTALEDYRSSEKRWNTYREVNRRYADAAIENFTDRDLIWIHDYHLTLVPQMIKDEYPDAEVAYFWHIPWPPWEMFGNLPWRNEILDGLLSSDFIGFHTPALKSNFFSCVEKVGISVDREFSTVDEGVHKTRVEAIPLGIDYEWFNSLSEDEKIQEKTLELKRNLSADKIILGVDRLDYTKGIIQRLEAFDLFLEENPRSRGEVTLVQRIPPSRTSVDEYQMVRERINRIIGEINGKFEETGWTPIKSFHRFLPSQEQLIPYYRAADVALITPLIDGMNLVSKEYIACTDGGVLILSEFAGAAEELGEAIIVNPYNTREVAHAIERALEMSGEEREGRLRELKRIVKNNDLNSWRRNFLEKWLVENDG